jgi:hypothetical protein
MVETVEVAVLPLAPGNPLPYLQQVKAVRAFHSGLETLRDAGGLVTRCSLAPAWITPTMVVVTSPKGARDVLGRPDAFLDKTLTDSARKTRRAGIAGSICRSAVGHDPASAITSPCSKPRWGWPPQSGWPKFAPSTTTFPSPSRLPPSPPHPSGPAYGRGNDAAFDRGRRATTTN